MTLVDHPIYILYKTGNYITVGKYNAGDHNGIKEEFVETLVDAVIPSHVAGIKVKVLSYQSFRYLPNLQTVFIPNTITKLDGDTFIHCIKLHTIIFEDNSQLKTTRHYEFYNTTIESITLPIRLNEISNRLFFNCTKLKTVVIQNFLSSTDEGMFARVPNDLKILVPKNYPSDMFGGRNVTKILDEYHGIKNLCKSLNYQSKIKSSSPMIVLSLLLMIKY